MMSGSMVNLSVTSIDGAVGGTSLADGLVRGLREATAYRIEIRGTIGRLFVDDVELPFREEDGCYAWTADFYAGEVVAIVVDGQGQEHPFRLDVCPHPAKLGGEQYAAMLDDIRAFDTSLLLGATSATLGFGREGRPGRWEQLVQLSRLRKHGPAFLSAVQGLVNTPHQALCATERPLHLRHLRRVNPAAMLDRRLAALCNGSSVDDEALQSLQLRSWTPAPTVDTPANRALKALLRKFLATTRSLDDLIERNGLRVEASEQASRSLRRREVLRTLSNRAVDFLRAQPFADMSSETTAAGLTQIAAQPRYARAYRLGTQAMRTATEGPDLNDQLPVSPSWGVYEAWCLTAVVGVLERLVGGPLSAVRSSLASADLTLGGRLPDGRVVELLFQAVFPSEEPYQRSLAWSVSGERRPDILLAVSEGSAWRWGVLDAKYRSGRENVFDAMTSAHVYRDSLRFGRTRPDWCLLLLPGPAAVPSLETDEFWAEHQVGSLSRFCIEGEGIGRLSAFTARWLNLTTAPLATEVNFARSDGVAGSKR